MQAAVQATESCFLLGQDELDCLEEDHARNISAEVSSGSDIGVRFRKPSDVASAIAMRLFEISASGGGRNLSLQTVLECGMNVFAEYETMETSRLEVRFAPFYCTLFGIFIILMEQLANTPIHILHMQSLIRKAAAAHAPGMDLPYAAFEEVARHCKENIHPDKVLPPIPLAAADKVLSCAEDACAGVLRSRESDSTYV